MSNININFLSNILENTKENLFQIDIPDTDTVIKEQTEWFKVDLPKKVIEHKKKPDWLRVKLPIGPKYTKLRKLVEENNLHTICTSGSCPNMGECWGEGTATFMILGNICTRSCKFCGVKTGKPLPVDWEEAEKVANSIRIMQIKHAVLTSVDRDDLRDDMGSKFWVETIKKIRELNPGITLEALIPDFQGIHEHIDRLVNIKPEVISHNIETTRRLTKEVRVQAKYDRSMDVLKYMKDSGQRRTKSGIMLGLGETKEEVIETIHDLKNAKVDIVTIGQYLQPSKKHLQVQRFVTPDEFLEYKEIGEKYGPIDITIINIGAYNFYPIMPYRDKSTFHTNPEEALSIARDLKSKKVIGMHWGTFVLSLEPIMEPRIRFKENAEKYGFKKEDALIFKIGEINSLTEILK